MLEQIKERHQDLKYPIGLKQYKLNSKTYTILLKDFIYLSSFHGNEQMNAEKGRKLEIC